MSDTGSEAPSGLGYVRVRAMNIEDTLPSHDYHHRGNRMQGAQDHIIKIYIRNPVTGDVFDVHVPYNMRVGPVKQPPLIGGIQLNDIPKDIPNLKAIVSEYSGFPSEQLRLMFKQETLKCDEASLNEYNICHGSTVLILTKTVRKSREVTMLACEANRVHYLTQTIHFRNKLLSAYGEKDANCLQFSPRWEHNVSPRLFEEGGILHRDSASLDYIYLDLLNDEARAIPAMKHHGSPFND